MARGPAQRAGSVTHRSAQKSADPGRDRAGSPRRWRGRGGGLRWLGLGFLIVIAVAVFAARSIKLPRSAEPSPAEAVPTALVTTPQAAAGRAEQPAAKPTVHTTPQAPAAPTGVTPRSTPLSTRGPVTASTAHATVVSTPGVGLSGPGANPGAGVGIVGPGATPALGVGAVGGVDAGATPGASLAPSPERGPSGELALTFDAGADRGYAEDILDILQDQHIVASFGITGLWAKANPDLVRRMVADGHLIINHSLDHRSFTGVSDKLGGLSAARRRAELDDADAIIAPLLGHTTRPWYRLPYGDDDARVATDLAPDGYVRKVGWTVDSLGWRGAQSADIVARCLKGAAPGAVYVFHVGRASQDAIALPQIIHGLREAGFGFRRVDQT